MLRPGYPLTTPRLVLRPFVEDDFDALYAIQSRADVARYLYWAPRNPDGVRDVVKRGMTRTSITIPGDGLSLVVELAECGELAGYVSLDWLSAEHGTGEVGFVFHPDHHGRGYATEATRALLRLGFDELRLHRVIGRCDARNTASARVLERLGMRREAHFRENEFIKGEWQDEFVYAILTSEWARQ